MATPVFLYRVFVASPGGLGQERESILRVLEEYNKHECLEKGVIYHPVIWEDAPPVMERPQDNLNKKVRISDFFILLLWDRWGSPPSKEGESQYSSGTEEEYREAMSCFTDNDYPMRDIAVMFKDVDKNQLIDAGPQLSAVLRFKEELTKSKEVFYSTFESTSRLESSIRAKLAQWTRDIGKDQAAMSSSPETDTLQFTGERLSLNFQDISVKAILQLLSDFAGVNIIISGTVQGSITLRLKNVPWDHALDLILRSNNLGMHREGNIIMVAPLSEMRQ